MSAAEQLLIKSQYAAEPAAIVDHAKSHGHDEDNKKTPRR